MLLPPVIPEDVELVRFNALLAHLLATLSMSQLEVIPSHHHTVTLLMELSFPGIKATDGKRTPLVSKHTIGYIDALMLDSVTSNSSEPPKPVLFETKLWWSKNPRRTRMSGAQNCVIAL
jgi:hypothetical protein